MPLYEVVVEQRYQGQQIINRFNYVGSGTVVVVTGSFALASALGFISAAGVYPSGTLLALWRAMVNPATLFIQAVVNNVYDPTDFYQTPFLSGTAGTSNTGDAEPPFVAFSFRSNQLRRDIRRGQKRFVGAGETVVADFGQVQLTYMPTLQALATEMSATQTYTDEGSNRDFIPAVVSKQKYTPAGSTQSAYRYYPTEIEQMAHIAQGVTWEAGAWVTTQNSRKQGRGS